MDVINTKLLLHPVNWAIVLTVGLFGGFAWHLIHARANSAPVAATT